jgi:hypothetical protein
VPAAPVSPQAPPDAGDSGSVYIDWSWLAAPAADGALPWQASEARALDSVTLAAGLATVFSWGAQPTDQEEQRRREGT